VLTHFCASARVCVCSLIQLHSTWCRAVLWNLIFARWSRNSLSWNSKVRRLIHMLHPPDTFEQVERGLTLASCFNIITSSTPRCFIWFLSFGFWNKCYFLRRGISVVLVECMMKKYNPSVCNFTVPTVMAATIVVQRPVVFLSLNFVLFSSPTCEMCSSLGVGDGVCYCVSLRCPTPASRFSLLWLRLPLFHQFYCMLED
jgi:hypothetical protein